MNHATRNRRIEPWIALLLLGGIACGPALGGEKRIALTFDDAPREDGGLFDGPERTRRLIEQLERAGVDEAMFFVVTSKIRGEDERRRLRSYAAAGHRLANHSHSHLWLSRTDTEAYIADIAEAGRILAEFPSYDPHFRFPYLDEGRTADKRDAVRRELTRLGLAHGYVTVDNYDWYLDHRVKLAREAGRTIDPDALREVYLEHVLGSVEFYDRIAVEYLGRSPAHVLLLHENDLAALFVSDLVELLRARGWKIIGAREAYSDPIASRIPDTLFNNQGRVAALAHLAGAERRALVQESEDEAVLDRLLEDRGVFGPPDD